MKGMLTGPVTILNWSFPREDVPRKLQSQQLALALRDEVIDLEAAGIAAIQVDEPAIREGVSGLAGHTCELSDIRASCLFVALTGMSTWNGLLTPLSLQQPVFVMRLKPTPTSATLTLAISSRPLNALTLMSFPSSSPRAT